MANFAISFGNNALSYLSRAIELTHALKAQPTLDHFEKNRVGAAVFARRNGTGGEIARDATHDAFLLICGTWLHRDGYGTGAASELLARFLTVGAEQLADELEGFFFLAATKGDHELVAITDIAGSHHAFVRQLDDHSIVISGSSLVLGALAPSDIDHIAVQEFVRTGIIYEDRTFYQQVRKLPPASVLHFRDGKLLHTKRYWHAEHLADSPLRLPEAADRLFETGTKTVARIAELYPRRLCDLTGGYDSRALGALLLGANIKFDTTVSGDDDSADVKISRGLAEIAGLEHSQRKRSNDLNAGDIERALQLCDGEYDLLEYARIMRTHEQHSQSYDVSMNGSYGEVARGYWWELLSPHIGQRAPLDYKKIARKRYAALDDGAALFPEPIDLNAHFTEILRRNGAGFERLPNTLQLDYSYLNLRMQRWQGRIASSTDQIWPCVSPFMFRSILEIMLRAEPRARHRSLLVRAMLARHYPTWAAYPLEHGYPAEPFGIRNAWRFLPLGAHYLGKIQNRLWPKASVRSADTLQTSLLANFPYPPNQLPILLNGVSPSGIELSRLWSLSMALARAKGYADSMRIP